MKQNATKRVITYNIFPVFIVFLLLVSGCTPSPATPSSEEEEPELYLNIIWHQHQPFYSTDTESGLVEAPWVRFHAAKDYVDMVTILEKYPDIHVTFNLTPSLLDQIDAFNTGQRDVVWEITLVPAADLTDGQKTYILQRFFDVNNKIIQKFPRYVELQQLRGGESQSEIDAALSTWRMQDFLDLQVLFNLAWTDPDYLITEPLSGLVAKGSGFSEEDKSTVLQVHADLLSQVIPIHRQYQDSGQIEITFTPYAHPILPLLIDTNLASLAVPDIKLPSVRFTHGDDAIQHLEKGMALYQEKFGRPPRGMWPAEGSVAQYMVGMTARAGVEWMVTDEGILSHSLDIDFTRLTDGVPLNATSLYRPYTVEGSGETVAIFFRDSELSNKISFDYSQIPAEEAVEDFMTRLRAIRDEVKSQSDQPYIVTVILDGENAWEWYENDGKAFLNGLYTELNNDTTIKTITSSEYLAKYTEIPSTIPELWAGSWDSATFQTWIGEDEENRAWEYLADTRNTFEEYLNGVLKGKLSEERIAEAYESLLAAEGSDWFWWYGSDKDSGNDAAFDAAFRETLGQVYDALSLDRPISLSIPIILPIPLEPDIPLQTLFTPTIDGELSSNTEWQNAGSFFFEEAPSSFAFGFDKDNLYLNFSNTSQASYEIYLKIPASSVGYPLTETGQFLGLYATHRITIKQEVGNLSILFQTWENSLWQDIASEDLLICVGNEMVEMAIPIISLQSTLDTGDSIQIRLLSIPVSSTDSIQILLPVEAPGRMLVPDLGRTTWLFSVKDPENDDHGPGSYTYPTDTVFKPGVFDLTSFQVGKDENNLVFRFEVRGPVENPWGSPNGLAIQLFDVYINTGTGGALLMRNGRNTSIDKGWDYALALAGWNYGFFDASEPEKISTYIPITIITDPSKHIIIAKIPLNAIPGDPLNWTYAVAVLSNDGYGINNVREISIDSGQWNLGGAPADTNHTRIIDYLWPEGLSPTQEEMLSGYPPSRQDPGSLTTMDFPQVQMYVPKP